MNKNHSSSEDGNIITMFAPIFRNNLKRLEMRGEGTSEEAEKLRLALDRIDHSRAKAAGTTHDVMSV
tara:strand:+ start:493 stop:693 length:201 start_codon:yes stop_codon:yes gene_type:complete